MSRSRRRKNNRGQSLLEPLDRRLLLSVQTSVAAQTIEVDGGTTDEFAVIFSSSGDVDPTTIKQGEVTISGPNGPIVPTLVSVSPPATPSLSVTAVFEFTPPGGKWEMVDNGTYKVDVPANTILDTQGGAVPAGSMGSFDVDIQPSIVLNDNTLVVNGSGNPDTISITRPDINIDVTEDGVSTLYDGDTITKISVVGGTASEDLTLSNVIRATVLGTNGNDTIIASSAGDSIVGYGGNDSLVGGIGNDTLLGAGGNDTLLGGAGNDSIRGGKGNDLMRGGGENDTLVAGPGTDSIGGGIGNDQINALSGDADTITGGAGSDTVHASASDDVLSATEVLSS